MATKSPKVATNRTGAKSQKAIAVDLKSDRLITVDEGSRFIGVSPRAWWNRVARDPEFPRPLYLSARSPRWLLSSVEDYIKLKTKQRAQRPAEAVKRDKAAVSA